MQKQAVGSGTVEKIVLGYQSVSGGQIDEDAESSRCKASMSFLEKAERHINGDSNSGLFYWFLIIITRIPIS